MSTGPTSLYDHLKIVDCEIFFFLSSFNSFPFSRDQRSHTTEGTKFMRVVPDNSVTTVTCPSTLHNGYYLRVFGHIRPKSCGDEGTVKREDKCLKRLSEGHLRKTPNISIPNKID